MASPGYARVQSAPRKAGVAPSVAADETNVFSPRKFIFDSEGERGGNRRKCDERRTGAWRGRRGAFGEAGESSR